MSVQKYALHCSFCKQHLKGKKQIKYGRVINLEEEGEKFCNSCEENLCNKNFNSFLCQQIQELKKANISLKERMDLEELEQELAKLTTENTPSPTMNKKQVSQELKQMQEQLDEEEKFKRLEIQAEKEMRMSPRKSLVKGEMRMSPKKSPAKEKKKGLLSKLSKIFSKKKKETSYY